MKTPKKKLSSFQIILLGFVGVVLLGAFLLSLPISSKNHEWTPFIDALFTSTSAVCVTGLIVFDTATHWTIFGQIVILLLIQIGGMGVVTIAVSLAVISGKKIGLFRPRNDEKCNFRAKCKRYSPPDRIYNQGNFFD